MSTTRKPALFRNVGCQGLTISIVCVIIILEEGAMNQVELLGFIIERGSVSSGEVAERFGVPIPFAHQVLRRLEEKGLLSRNGGPYRFGFELSRRAKKKLQNLHGNHKGYGWILLLGLAVGLLIGFSSRKRGNKNDDSGDKDNQNKFFL